MTRQLLAPPPPPAVFCCKEDSSAVDWKEAEAQEFRECLSDLAKIRKVVYFSSPSARASSTPTSRPLWSLTSCSLLPAPLGCLPGPCPYPILWVFGNILLAAGLQLGRNPSLSSSSSASPGAGAPAHMRKCKGSKVQKPA